MKNPKMKFLQTRKYEKHMSFVKKGEKNCESQKSIGNTFEKIS